MREKVGNTSMTTAAGELGPKEKVSKAGSAVNCLQALFLIFEMLQTVKDKLNPGKMRGGKRDVKASALVGSYWNECEDWDHCYFCITGFTTI